MSEMRFNRFRIFNVTKSPSEVSHVSQERGSAASALHAKPSRHAQWWSGRASYPNTVSWKLLTGTFHTNLTYRVGLRAMDPLKRQAWWKQRLDFLWHKKMRFRISTCGVGWAENSLQAHVWEISWRNNRCEISHLPRRYFSAVPKSSHVRQNLAA